jgi:ribonuclease J
LSLGLAGRSPLSAACIEIASDNTRIILDCGWPLDAERMPPAVPGLFDGGAPPDAVLLSHAHPDHTGFIAETADKVQVYATASASKIMKVGSIYARGVEIPRERFQEVPVPSNWREPVQPFSVGDVRVTAYPVDHSSPGAVGYLVEHKNDRTFYTGDLRLHGRKPGMQRRILNDLSGRLNLPITEGTNVGRPQSGLPTEEAVEQRAVELTRDCRSLVLAAYSPQNLDRFISFFSAAKQSGRTFVRDHYQAVVLYQLNERALPKPSRDGLRVYLPGLRTVVDRYERRFHHAVIELDEILATRERYLMLARPPMILGDFAGRLPQGTRLLYGMWSGYLGKTEWQQTSDVLHAVGGEMLECHASGHAHGNELLDFIEKLAPSTVPPGAYQRDTYFSRAIWRQVSHARSAVRNLRKVRFNHPDDISVLERSHPIYEQSAKTIKTAPRRCSRTNPQGALW